MITHGNNKGFTLIESMVAIVISTILIAAVTATYVVQNRSYTSQDDVAEINTQSKIAHDIIKKTIKGAPFSFSNIPEPDNLPAVMYGFSSTNVITPTDNLNTPDAISILTPFAIGHIWPTGTSPASGLTCDGRQNPALSSSVLGGDLILTGSVEPIAGSYLLISGREFAIVSTYTAGTSAVTFSANTGQDHLLSDTTGDNICNRGATVYLIIDTTFCVDANNFLRRIRMGSNPALCTGTLGGEFNQIIAENIEDLQFAYAVDANAPDGEIDGSADMLDDTDFVSSPPAANYQDIRAVRINILTRTEKTVSTYSGLGNPPLNVENRQHAQPGDDFKRRWMQSIVLIKNLEEEIQ
jgi:prepilin-type N-terminal cleavage/methylation domain-containing protein